MCVSDRRANDYANGGERRAVNACVFEKKSLTLDRKYQSYRWRICTQRRRQRLIVHAKHEENPGYTCRPNDDEDDDCTKVQWLR